MLHCMMLYKETKTEANPGWIINMLCFTDTSFRFKNRLSWQHQQEMMIEDLWYHYDHIDILESCHFFDNTLNNTHDM